MKQLGPLVTGQRMAVATAIQTAVVILLVKVAVPVMVVYPRIGISLIPVIGDATGTSVSASIAKLNKNLGKHIGLFSENTDRIYQRVNE